MKLALLVSILHAIYKGFFLQRKMRNIIAQNRGLNIHGMQRLSTNFAGYAIDLKQQAAGVEVAVAVYLHTRSVSSMPLDLFTCSTPYSTV